MQVSFYRYEIHQIIHYEAHLNAGILTIKVHNGDIKL